MSKPRKKICWRCKQESVKKLIMETCRDCLREIRTLLTDYDNETEGNYCSGSFYEPKEFAELNRARSWEWNKVK